MINTATRGSIHITHDWFVYQRATLLSVCRSVGAFSAQTTTLDNVKLHPRNYKKKSNDAQTRTHGNSHPTASHEIPKKTVMPIDWLIIFMYSVPRWASQPTVSIEQMPIQVDWIALFCCLFRAIELQGKMGTPMFFSVFVSNHILFSTSIS